ncbi:unnamed protein product [Pylaiella littoralis]
MMRYALMERDEFVSQVIDEACHGLGTNETLLIDALAPLSNEEVDASKTHWEAKNDESLVDKLNSEIRRGFKELIVSLLTGKRTESEQADEPHMQIIDRNASSVAGQALAEEQATQLYDAGIGKFVGTDDEVFIEIIGTSPSVQLQAIRAKYEEARGMSLHKAISKEFRGDLKTALQCMLEPPVDFYCAGIKRATKRMGTNEVAICRILGGNDKAQLAAISDRFTEKYDMTLSDMAKAELGGHFKEAVLAWVDAAADPTKGIEQQIAALPDGDDGAEERLQLLQTENDNMKQFIARVDAQQIRRSCKGIGTNEGRIVNIMCTRTKSQVERIDQAYREMFDMTLREQLKSDLSGDFKTFMVFTQMETQEFDALLMRQAMAGIGTDEDIMIMLLTTRDNEAISAAQTYFEGRYDESLVDKISSEMSGSFRDLLLVLLRGERDESAEGDPDAAEAQAEALHNTDDKNATFVEILAKSSRAQVACIRKAYENKYGRSLAKTIEKKFYGKMEGALLSLLFDPIENFARGLKAAFHGLGTDKNAVCRILGGNDKQTCRTIAERFEEKYDQSLVDALKKELRGTLEKGTIAWVSAVDPAAGKEGFRIASEVCVQGEEDQEAGEEREGDLETPRRGGTEEEEEEEDEGDISSLEEPQEEPEEEPEEEPVDDEEAEEESEDDDQEEAEAREERHATRKAAKRKKAKLIKARLAKARRQAEVEERRKEKAKKRRMFAQRVTKMARLSREQVAFAAARRDRAGYSSEPIEGLTVWGKWDSELYVKHNEDVEGEHGWSHFAVKSGFLDGKLVRIDNKLGAFVGVVDMSAYMDKHGIDDRAVGKKGPFEKPLVGFKHYVETGTDEGLDIAITQVIPVYLLGEFDPRMYLRANKSAKQEMAPPRPGKFDDDGYRRLHPEIEEDGLQPFQHFRANRQNEICVRGRTGLVNRRWYKVKYGKKFRHFFRAGYRKGLHIKIKGRGLTPLEHFCTRGFEEGRQLRAKTGVGVFDGKVDWEAFLEVNPAAGESGMEPTEFYMSEGKEAGAKLPLTNIEVRRAYASCIDGDGTAVAAGDGDLEGDDGEVGSSEDEDDDDDGDDGDGDDDDDDGDGDDDDDDDGDDD